jgi:hypothetical protein
MTDYFPIKNAAKVIWLTNLKTKIVESGSALGLSAEKILEIQNNCTIIIDAITKAQVAKAAQKSAVSASSQAIKKEGGALRTEINRLKNDAAFTSAIGKTLNIIGGRSKVDKDNYKAKIAVEIFAGRVQIKFVKKGVDAVNIYHRKGGAAEWSFLAHQSRSPYHNPLALEVPGQPEHWEYRAFGIINDDEIGIASDIVEIVFGG